MSTTPCTPRQLREAIVATLPADPAAEHGQQGPERQSQLYLPSSHTRALRLESSLVIGGRGVGKSVWSEALQGNVQESGVLPPGFFPAYSLSVQPGCGISPKRNIYPDPDTFDALLARSFPAFAIWRGVLCRALAQVAGQDCLPKDSWESTVGWVQTSPEDVARLIEDSDRILQQRDQGLLLVFDALDRVSSSGRWSVVDKAIGDLMRLVLQLKGSRRIHAKVFLRTDQYERGNFAGIPDFSKLQSTRVELIWSASDLHGLLWQTLTNGGPDAARDQFRSWCDDLSRQGNTWSDLPRQGKLSFDPPAMSSGSGAGRWPIPQELQRNQRVQRRIFQELAGPWMGKDRRRGVPYVWIVNHLADGQGQTTPRSFLAALRHAAEDSLERYRNHPLALHYDSLKRGVQAASQIRIDELAEDHAWMRDVMRPLAGIMVPCSKDDVLARWRNEWGALQSDGGSQSSEVSRLVESLPESLARDDWPGVLKYLEQLGLITWLRDGRLNMPDLFRVGFRLGRRGGIKPALRHSRSA